MTSFDYSFGVKTPTIDDFVNKQYPSVILAGTEINAVTSQIIEVSGSTWIVTNAMWNAPLGGFQQQNVAVPSSALVTTSAGMVSVYTAPVAAPSPIVWTGQSLSTQIANPYNALYYGIKGDGVTDDGPAINALLATIPTNAVVQFPPPPGGSYVINTQVVMTKPVSFMGYGGRSSVQFTGNVAGTMILDTSVYSFKMSGIRMSNSGGSCVALYGHNAIVAGSVMQNYGSVGDGTFEDMYFISGSGYDAVLLNNAVACFFNRCSITGGPSSGVGGTSSGIHVTGTGVAASTGKPQNGVNLGYSTEIHITDSVIGARGSYSDTTSAGLRFDGECAGIYVQNVDFISWAHSILVAPNTRTATYVDSGTTNTYTFNGFAGEMWFTNTTPNSTYNHNVVLQPADATSAVNDVHFANCQIASASLNTLTNGVLLDAYTNGGIVSGVHFVNCGVGQNSLHGVQVRACNNVTFKGGYITGNQRFNTGGAYNIVIDGAASTNILFEGVNMTDPYNQTFVVGYATLGGIYIGPYAHSLLKFRDVNLTGTPGFIFANNLPLAQQKTGQLEVRGCPGINPIGISASNLSPALSSGTTLYNVAPTTTTVMVGGGTVSAIAVNGTTTGMTSGAFPLEPGETIAITYSAAPTVTAKAA